MLVSGYIVPRPFTLHIQRFEIIPELKRFVATWLKYKEEAGNMLFSWLYFHVLCCFLSIFRRLKGLAAFSFLSLTHVKAKNGRDSYLTRKWGNLGMNITSLA